MVASGTQLASLGDWLAGKDTDKDSSRRAWAQLAALAGGRSGDRRLFAAYQEPLELQDIPVPVTGRGVGNFRA